MVENFKKLSKIGFTMEYIFLLGCLLGTHNQIEVFQGFF